MTSAPLTIVNFKTYPAATGGRAVKLAKDLAAAAKEMKKEIVVAAQAADIFTVAKHCKVFAQHIDYEGYGKFTGAVTADAVKQAGAVGTLINHSEKQLSTDAVGKTIEAAKAAGLIAVVCADTPERAAELSRLKPDFIAIEPPELIAGKISVSEAKPEVITNTIKRVSMPVLCGAGVNKKEDVITAQKLGAAGILVANAVVNGKNPALALKDLLSGYK